MRTPLACALALVLALLPAGSGAQTAAPAAPAGTVGPATAAHVTERTLPNGLQVVVVMHHEQPAVTRRLLVKAGTASDPREQLGLARQRIRQRLLVPRANDCILLAGADRGRARGVVDEGDFA